MSYLPSSDGHLRFSFLYFEIKFVSCSETMSDSPAYVITVMSCHMTCFSLADSKK